jgi:cell division protein ZipA
MPELRWILIAFGLALLAGIYFWGRRSAKASSPNENSPVRLRPEPLFETDESYDDARDADSSFVDEPEDRAIADAAIDAPVLDRTGSFETPEVSVPRSHREPRRERIEPTFGDESVTAELPVDEVPAEPAAKPEPSFPAPSSPGSLSRAPSSPASSSIDAPTLSMSSAPSPRRIERRKIIALRLAAGPQRIPGAQLKAALEAESLQHGKYDVFHRLDGQGVAIFSVASMVEPGTFDLEKMTQEMYPGVTLFTQLPAPFAGMLAFNELVACARRLHAALGGTLQDERGVPLTVHRIERLRQEIREFEHRSAGESAQRAGSDGSPSL